MTFADLMTLFREAQNEARKAGAITQGEMDANGIRAVISALRNDGAFLKTWEEAQLARAYRRVE